MIPTASGRVRKLRVSYRTAGLLLLLLGCLSALFTYTAVNFGELHIARSYAQTVISRLEGERESLSQQNVALRGEVELSLIHI